MGWRQCGIMDERLKFVARILDGEQMTSRCEEFGISGKTGYKIFNRYKESGLEAITDRSRRPVRYGNQLPFQIEKYILSLKQDKPSWGARKLHEKLIRKYPDVKPPAISTIHAVLDRNGLVVPRGRKRNRATGTELSEALHPNVVHHNFTAANVFLCFTAGVRRVSQGNSLTILVIPSLK